MNVKSTHKKTRCPACGSKSIHTQGLDQICLDCDWTNSQLLVDLGQMDQLVLAAHCQFVRPLSFDDLNEIEVQQIRIQNDLDLDLESKASA